MPLTVIAVGLLLVWLGGCSVGIAPPAQPTPATIVSTQQSLATITSDPVGAWQAGNYEVRAACHAYLNASATKSANLGLLGGLAGLGGAAAAGAGNLPAAGALSLFQSFLSLYQASGAIPYGPATSTLIENALDAYEQGVNASPPTSVAQAASFVDDAWWLCSPGGYAQLMERAGMSASVSTMTTGLRSAAFAPLPPRPVIMINGR